MKHYRRFFALVLAGVLLLACTACSGGNEDKTAQPTDATTTVPDSTREPAPTDPSFDVTALFERLEGYWNAADKELGWFLQFSVQDGKHSLCSGVWGSETSGNGEMTGWQRTGEYEATMTFLFLASEGELARPETIVNLQLDYIGLESGGPIKMKLDKTVFGGNLEWNTFVYGGADWLTAHS